MKRILRNSLLIKLLIIVVSCSTSNEVSHNSLIQKRKFTKGYHFSIFNKKIERNFSFQNQIDNDQNQIENKKLFENNFDLATIDLEKENQVNFKEETYSDVSLNNNTNTIYIKKNKKILSKKLTQITNYNKVIKTQKNELNLPKNKITPHLKSNAFSREIHEKTLLIFLLILAFILPPLAVLFYTNLNWKKVLISLLLTLLWWLPGVFYAILVILEIL